MPEAKAPDTTPTTDSPPSPVTGIHVKRETAHDRRQEAASDRFSAHYAEWLSNRAKYRDPAQAWTMEEEFAHSDREDELARLITTTPAVHAWMIYIKLEVLHFYLAGDTGTAFTDNREVVMLAGIHADIIKFGVGGSL